MENLDLLGTPMPDKSFHIFEQTGHSPMGSEVDLFVELVIDFVKTYE